MELPTNLQELTSFFNQTAFVNATVAQINKDLQGLYYKDFEFDPEAEKKLPESLVQALAIVLTELSKHQPEQLSQFIYRVDLAEKKFMEAVAADLTFQKLAFYIIEREALKVYLRLKFR